jgi:SAM-dependent methyltransferase
VDSAWQWDPSLYEGSARYYSTGRMAYPAAVVQTLRSALELDGTGRLLDVGCGPGSLTVLLAPQFAEATGVDADPDMLVEAGRRAAAHGVDNITWRHLRAEALPGDLGLFRLVTFAQSFHWFDRPRVAAAVRTMLGPDGACVHVHATTHQGVDDDTALPHPRPPRAEIAGLVQRYLGSTRRAGQGVLPDGTPGGEGDVFQSAGFRGPQRLELTEAPVVTRSADQVVASIFSLSSSAPHLFGDRLDAFERDLRAIIHEANPAGVFSERMRSIALDIWRP